MAANFDFVIRDGGIDAKGELDMASAPMLASILAAFDGHMFTLDLSNVTFIDSTGIKTLLAARRHHGGLHIVHPSSQVLRVFEVTAVTAFLLEPGEARGEN
jgi:anti-anti-sigma factor